MVELKTKIDGSIDDLAIIVIKNVIFGIIKVLGHVLSDDILEVCKNHLRGKGYNSISYNSINDDDITILNDAKLSDDEVI